MEIKIKEDKAYNSYCKLCKEVGIKPFTFIEWRLMGRPKSYKIKDGYYGGIA